MSDDKTENGTDVHNEKSSLDLEPNISAVLAYLGTIITGINILIIEKKSKFVRFHAMQSIIFFGIIWISTIVVGWFPIVGWFLSGLISAVGVIGWIFLMYKAYHHEYFKLPYIGNSAENFIK